MHIQLPDSAARSAEQLAMQAGFSDIGQYLAHLIDREQEDALYHSEIEKKLLDGLNTPSSPMTSDDWAALRERIVGSKHS